MATAVDQCEFLGRQLCVRYSGELEGREWPDQLDDWLESDSQPLG